MVVIIQVSHGINRNEIILRIVIVVHVRMSILFVSISIDIKVKNFKLTHIQWKLTGVKFPQMHLLLFSTKDNTLFNLLEVFPFLIFRSIFNAYLFSVHFHRNIFHNITFFYFTADTLIKGEMSRTLLSRENNFSKRENLFFALFLYS